MAISLSGKRMKTGFRPAITFFLRRSPLFATIEQIFIRYREAFRLEGAQDESLHRHIRVAGKTRQFLSQRLT